MQDDKTSNRKYVFVCGMPRSGTSVLGRNVGRLDNCTDFKNTGVLEDEGQFLQDVYPVASKLGGAGSFGFDPRAHRTEKSSLLTAENIARLRACWHAHWDNSKTIFVEKTPGNLLMTRFLQAAFPNSCFVVIKRHPVPVAMAAQKWKVDMSSLDTALEHWLHCHDLFEQDKSHLKNVYELRYEDYVENADMYHREIAAFIGTRVPEIIREDKLRRVTQWRNATGLVVSESAMEPTSGVHNAKYLKPWSRFLTDSFFKCYYRHMARKYEPRVTKHGYSLIKGSGLTEDLLRSDSRISDALGAMCCHGADACALFWRTVTQAQFHSKRLVRALLPRAARESLSGFGESAERPNRNPASVTFGGVRQLGPFSS